jgi:hypothetical protein
VQNPFFNRIRLIMGAYVLAADVGYLTLFLDFVNTIERLQSGVSNMNEEQLAFFRDRGNDIQLFLDATKNFKKELRTKVETLGGLIEVERYTKCQTVVLPGWANGYPSP